MISWFFFFFDVWDSIINVTKGNWSLLVTFCAIFCCGEKWNACNACRFISWYDLLFFFFLGINFLVMFAYFLYKLWISCIDRNFQKKNRFSFFCFFEKLNCCNNCILVNHHSTFVQNLIFCPLCQLLQKLRYKKKIEVLSKKKKNRNCLFLFIYFPNGIKVGDPELITTYKLWHCLHIYTHTIHKNQNNTQTVKEDEEEEEVKSWER